MRLALIGALVVVSAAAPAYEVKDCQAAHVGLDALTGSLTKTSRSFADGAIRVFNVDTEEPVACAAGVAITFAGAQTPGAACVYVGCFASVSDVSGALAHYDARRGLLLQLKYGVYAETGPSKPDRPLKIRINRRTETVVIEK